MPSEPASGSARHLHPATLLFTFGGLAKALLIPALAVLLLAEGDRTEVWLLALLVPGIIYQVLHYLTLTYRFTPGELVVRRGLIFRNERHIPYSRIHNIDLVEGPLHRILGVADVRLQTASGAEAEAELQVLSLAAAEEMRERVFADWAERPEAAAQGPEPVGARTLVRLTPGELVLLGLISFRGIVLVGVALGFALKLDLLERLKFDPEQVIDRFADAAASPPRFVVILAAAFGALVLLFALSIAWTVLRFSGYWFERAGDDLRIRCGLLTRISATVPRHRIQFISVGQTVMHRLFGYVAVRVETAGGGEDEDDVSRKWFIPLLKRDQLPAVLGELRPGLDLAAADWQPLAPRALRRKMTRSVRNALLASAATAFVIGWGAAAVGVVLVSWAVVHAVLAIRMTRYAVISDGIAFRSGVLTHAISATFFDKMQILSASQSPLDRYHRMATLSVDTAGAGPADHRIRIPYLEVEQARSLLRELSARTEETVFRW